MKIIDVHAHLGDVLSGRGLDPPFDGLPWPPEPVPEDAYAEYAVWKRRAAKGEDCEERHGLATLPHLLRHALSCGVNLCVLQPIEPLVNTDDTLALLAEYKSSWRMMLADSRSVDMVRSEKGLPAAATELADNAEPPVAFRSFASIHPLDPDMGDKVRRYKDAGCLGLKAHPIIQNLAPEHPAWKALLDEWAPTGLPVMVHTGMSGYKTPRSIRDGYGDARRFACWLASFPHTAFVMAHLNMLEPQAVFELAARHDNVHADASFHGPAKIKEALDRMGTERVMFGADFPFGMTRYALKAGLAATEGDPLARSRFFHDNARALLGVSVSEIEDESRDRNRS